MNKVLKEALFKQQVRKIHRDAVRNLMTEQEDNLYTTFIQPFKDVVDAVGLTGQDILNSVKLNLDLLLTISPKKMDAALKSFDERKAKINEKWAPIMERTQKALGGADADLLAFVVAPHLFLATTALQKGYEASGNLGKALGDAGFKIPFASAILGYTPDETPDKPTKPGKEKGILGKMISLFYIEGTWHEGDLILEKPEEKKKEKPDAPPLDKALKDYLDQTGLGDQFKKDADEMLDATVESLEDPKKSPLPQGVVQLAVTKKLATVDNLEDFLAIFDMARAEGLDLKESGLDVLKKEIDDGIEKLMKSDDFKRQVAGEADKSQKDDSEEQKATSGAETDKKAAEKKVEEGDLLEAEIEMPKDADAADQKGEASEEVPEVPEDKLLKAAGNVIFNNSAQNMRSKASDAAPKMEKQLTDYIDDVTPAKGSLEVIKTDARGAKIISLIDEYKKKISG